MTHHETYEAAALRGLQEELNIQKPDSLTRIREMQQYCSDIEEENIHDHEWVELYFASYSGEFKGKRRKFQDYVALC